MIWRKIIHQGNIPIGELDSTNGISRWFVRGLGIAEGTGDVVAEIDVSGDAHYYLSNHRGDTVVVLAENGTQQCQLCYDAFGSVVTNTGSFFPKFTFSTKEFLESAELYLYEYRPYGPLSGRWLQRDPIDYQDSVNLYQFCGNNPVNGVDEFGLEHNYCNPDDGDFSDSYKYDMTLDDLIDYSAEAYNYYEMSQVSKGFIYGNLEYMKTAFSGTKYAGYDTLLYQNASDDTFNLVLKNDVISVTSGGNIKKSSGFSITATGRELNYFSVGAATKDRDVNFIIGNLGVIGHKLEFFELPSINTLTFFNMGRGMSSKVVTKASQNSFNNKYGYERK